MKKYITDPGKAALYLFSAIIFETMSFMSLADGHTVMFVIFGAAFLVYLGLSVFSCFIFSVDEKGVTRSFFNKVLVHIPWEQVQEFGIANLKIMKNHDQSKIGEVYIYFSSEQMTEEERYSMCLNWPPKNICYLRFSPPRLKEIQQFTDMKPVLFWMTEEAYLNKYFR